MNRLYVNVYLLIFSVCATLAICYQSTIYGQRVRHRDPVVVRHDALDTSASSDKSCPDDGRKDTEQERNAQHKQREQVQQLVDEGVAFFRENSLAHTCDTFSNTRKFTRGAQTLFVLTARGVCLAHGEDDALIWQNLHDQRDAHGMYVVQEMIKKADEGGGWISHEWRGASRMTYVKSVVKDGVHYVVGSGYYTHTKEEAALSLVRGGVSALKEALASGQLPQQVFSEMSYPMGRFVRGDLYLYVLDADGVLLAHGRRPGLVGSQAWDVQDARGKKPNQDIINRLKDEPDGVWVEYVVHNALKRVYAEVVKDKAGKRYHLICGYYPEEGYEKARELVRRASGHISTHGRAEAVRAFTGGRDDRFREGSMYVVVYDGDGVCVAHGGNPELIGQNHLNLKDEEGNLYVRDLIRKARDGGGWVTAKLKHDFKAIYAERTESGAQELIVLAGFYPVSRHERMKLLVKSAARTLRDAGCRDTAFAEFVRKDGRFVQGDLRIFAFDTAGVCYAYGDRRHLIWRNLIDMKDDAGTPFISEFITRARGGNDTVAYKLFGAPAVAYVEAVTHDGAEYVVGSSYYQ